MTSSHTDQSLEEADKLSDITGRTDQEGIEDRCRLLPYRFLAPSLFFVLRLLSPVLMFWRLK